MKNLLFIILISIGSFGISSCQSPKKSRSMASEDSEGVRNLQLQESYTLRATDKEGRLEIVLELQRNDVIRIRDEYRTGPMIYIDGERESESSRGWYQGVEIISATGLSEDQIIEYNNMSLYVSESVLSHALELRDGNLGIDCDVVAKGCLLKRNSDTVIIFFRGWHQRYQGSGVPQSKWKEAAYDLLTDGWHYGGSIPMSNLDLDSSIFTMGDHQTGLTTEEMDRILAAAGAEKLIFASHSGGWKGLQYTITPAPTSYWEKVKGIWLLDNFYSTGFAAHLERNFGRDFLIDNCYGYTVRGTNNYTRYRDHYSDFCPKVLDRGVGHGPGVGQCMPYFEDEQRCSP